MPDYSVIINLLVVLISASLGGLLAKKLKQPLIFGYLFGGFLFSIILSKFHLNKDFLSLLSEIGLAFLMFTLGLEFSLKKVNKIKKVVISGAALQILLTILLGTLLLKYIFNFDFKVSFVLSGAFSLSSTAIVIKILQEKNKLESLSGEIMFGWLLIQDVAVLPLVGLLPVFMQGAGNQSGLTGIALSLGKSILVLAITWFLAQKALPKLANFITTFKSRELLLLTMISLVFFFATMVSFFGFSFALGAFLVGLILSQSPTHFAIFSEIRPLRDVFLAIFFVSLGLTINSNFIVTNIGKIVIISAIFLLLKMVLTTRILSGFGYHAKTIIESSFGLAEVGEFAFVYAMTALSAKIINLDQYSLVVSITLFTMVLTPSLFSLADKVYAKASIKLVRFPSIYKKYFVGFDNCLPLEEIPFENHVVILGYGRVGKWIGNVLDKVKVPYLVVEYNPEIVRELKLEGKKVVFGDPSDLDTLDFAQVDKARLVVVAVPDPVTQKIAITNCRLLNSKVKLICRSHVEEDVEELKYLGADNIIQPEFEAALSISHRALQEMGFGKEEINDKLRDIKSEHERR